MEWGSKIYVSNGRLDDPVPELVEGHGEIQRGVGFRAAALNPTYDSVIRIYG
jgi:hypothetical protein